MDNLIGVTNDTVKSLRGEYELNDNETMQLQYIWDSRNQPNLFTIVEVGKDKSSDTQSFKVGVVANERVVHISGLLNRIELGNNVREKDFVTVAKTGKNVAGILINDLFLNIKPKDNNENTLLFDAACRYISF